MGKAVQKTILLVEDEAIVLLATAKMLERHGFRVLTAGSGETAVDIALTRPEIDLVLMDIDLGAGMDGTQAAELILSEQDLPLVFLSSHTEQTVVDRTERITSYGYIVKNTGETVLLASINMAFRLWEAEQNFRSAFENVQVGMVLVSPQGRLLRVNEAFAQMLGYSRQEITAAEFATLTHPDDVAGSLLGMQAMLRGEADRKHFSKRYLHRNGQVVWADVSAILLRNSAGEPLHFVTHVRDTTVERQNQEYLRRTDHILASTADGIALLDESYHYRFVNRAYERFSGRSRASLIGLHVSEYLGDTFFREHVKPNFDRCLAGETIQYKTWVAYEALGRRFVHVTYSPYQDESGRISGVIANTQDITNEVESMNALLETRNRLAGVLAAVPTGVGVVQGQDRTIIEANENLCAMTGYSRAELLGRGARFLYPTQEDFEYVGREKYRQIAEHGVGTVETRWKRSDKTIIDVLLSSAPIDPADHSLGVTFTAMDITTRKRNERRINALISEKEARAREIQHRVKNTMNTMVSLLTIHIETLGEDSAAIAALGDARSRLRSMEVLYSMLYQADTNSDGSTREYLEQLVRAVVDLFPVRVAVTPVLDIDELSLDIRDLSTLGLIVNELVTNAMKYAFPGPEPGVLSVTGRCQGGRLSVTVHDTGPGFDTNSPTARLGFGLTMVRTLAAQLGGSVRFEQEKGMRAVLEWARPET